MPARKDINSLTADELQLYIHALSILRKRSEQNPEDTSGYDYQARIHNDQEVGPCEHGNDLFFPWHRCHLYHFEKLLQQSDPPRTLNVTIPYWDWSRPDPAGGRYPKAFSMEGLAAFRSDDGPALPPDTISIVKKAQTWNEFGGWPVNTPEENYGAFELGPHNFMHGNYIGGLMADPMTAAEDPIYWSFHAFIDFMWAEWQRRNPDKLITSPDATLRGFDHLGTPQRVRDFVGIYEYSDPLRNDLLVPEKPPVSLSIGTAKPLFERSIKEQLSTGPADFALAGFNIQRRMILKLKGMNLPKVASYTIYAYVVPRGTDVSTLNEEQRASAYAGYVAVWTTHRPKPGAGHGHHGHAGGHHHPATVNSRIDVTDAVKRARASGSEDLVASLVFKPNLLPSGSPAPAEEVYKELELDSVDMQVTP